MADAARFPHLAVPFAITGAVGGWLSAGLVQHPLWHPMNVPFRAVAAAVAAAFGLATGLLLRRWCVGSRYAFQLDAPDPDTRPPGDSWPRHLLTLVLAGTAAGSIACSACDMASPVVGAISGFFCTLPFLPVCAAVLASARRAQRARLGSIVAAADRRAVALILAATLLIATLESLPDWPAAALSPLAGPLSPLAGPLPALVALLVLTGCILTVLLFDGLALRRARRILVPGLARRDLDDARLDRDTAARVDLGLGGDLHAHLAQGGPAYRTRERALALILGDPERVLSALRRAFRRDLAALALSACVLAAHLAAGSDAAFVGYQELACRAGNGFACSALADHCNSLDPRDLVDAVRHYQRGCDRGDGWSCLSIANMYSGRDAFARDAGMVALYEHRAAWRGVCPLGTILIDDHGKSGLERFCVLAADPRVPGSADFRSVRPQEPN